MIRHIVVWRLSATEELARREDAETIVAALSALPTLIPEIGTLSAGTNVAFHANNWDLGLVIDFASVEALDAYRVHPAHQHVVAIVKTRVSQRASIDLVL
jgi:hypothetical protein